MIMSCRYAARVHSIRTLIVAVVVLVSTRAFAVGEVVEFSGPRGTILTGTISSSDLEGSTGQWSVAVEGAGQKQVVLGFGAETLSPDAATAEIPLLVVVQPIEPTSHATVIVRRGDRVVSMTEIVIHRTRDLADLNADGLVNSADLTVMLAAWGRCARESECPADLDTDGWVDGRDLSLLVAAWQP